MTTSSKSLQGNDSAVPWSCSQCTFLNRRYDKMCEVCLQDRAMDQSQEKPDKDGKKTESSPHKPKPSPPAIQNPVRSEMATVEARLQRIDTILKANNELIQQINAHTGQINLVTYVITRQPDGRHVAAEQITASPAQNVIAQWRGSIELNKVPDVFNDKINFGCTNYQDLVRLNRDMFTVAQKYELFGDGQKAIREIGRFEDNYRLIQTALQQLLELLNTGGRGHLADVQNRLQDINSCIQELQDKYKNLRFA